MNYDLAKLPAVIDALEGVPYIPENVNLRFADVLGIIPQGRFGWDIPNFIGSIDTTLAYMKSHMPRILVVSIRQSMVGPFSWTATLVKQQHSVYTTTEATEPAKALFFALILILRKEAKL